MLFFNVPEQDKGWEDCEEKVLDIIDRNKMFGEEDTLPSLENEKMKMKMKIFNFVHIQTLQVYSNSIY